MKRIAKLLISLAFLLSVIGSFFAGSYWNEQKQADLRTHRCIRLISFAIDKVENHDLTDDDVQKALIGNLYAAQEFCDDVALHAQLNDLWNTLIYRSESYIGYEEELAAHLHQIAESLSETN